MRTSGIRAPLPAGDPKFMSKSLGLLALVRAATAIWDACSPTKLTSLSCVMVAVGGMLYQREGGAVPIPVNDASQQVLRGGGTSALALCLADLPIQNVGILLSFFLFKNKLVLSVADFRNAEQVRRAGNHHPAL